MSACLLPVLEQLVTAFNRTLHLYRQHRRGSGNRRQSEMETAERLIEVQAADLLQLGQQLGEVYGAAIEDGLARVEQFYCVHVYMPHRLIHFPANVISRL